MVRARFISVKFLGEKYAVIPKVNKKITMLGRETIVSEGSYVSSILTSITFQITLGKANEQQEERGSDGT